MVTRAHARRQGNTPQPPRWTPPRVRQLDKERAVALLRASPATGLERAVLQSLCLIADEYGYCAATLAELAACAGAKTPEAARRPMRHLIERGEVAIILPARARHRGIWCLVAISQPGRAA